MNLRILVFLTITVLTGMGLLHAADDVTIKGEVVDLVSYMASGVKTSSPQGMEIAKASAAAGNPLGILEEGTGRLYVVTMKQANTGANQTLGAWMGTRITAKGQVHTKGSTRVLILTTIGKSMN